MELIIVLTITWIISILSVYIGYVIGAQQTDKPIKIKLPKFKKKTKVGAIQHISQRELELKGTRRGAAEKAMVETLDEII